MLTALRRRIKLGVWRRGWCYFCTILAFVLFTNVLVIQRNFNALEDETHTKSAGFLAPRKLGVTGSHQDVFLKRRLHAGTERNVRYMFEEKLQNLLRALENNIQNSSSFGNQPRLPHYERYFSERLLFCDEIRHVTNITYLASGWTKAVYKGLYKGSPVALKTVDLRGEDVSTCVQSGRSDLACYVRAAKKIVKEFVVLQALANKNVLKVLGFCLPRNADDNLRVTMVTELGESVDLIKLLQMSWEDRLRVCLDITTIVQFMSQTPYGSMSMNDFRRQQFVLVGGVLKLSDVDDTGFDDPICVRDNQCTVTFSSVNFTYSTRCENNRCVMYNEKRNVFNAGRHFVTFLLPHGAPSRFQPIIDKVIDGYNNLTMTSSSLLDAMSTLVDLYKLGRHLNRTTPEQINTEYKRTDNADMPGLFDYRCRFSLSMGGCTISVFDQKEAEDVCNTDEACKGFVMSSKKTWTGRILVHLKNGVSDMKYNPETTFYLKPSWETNHDIWNFFPRSRVVTGNPRVFLLP